MYSGDNNHEAVNTTAAFVVSASMVVDAPALIKYYKGSERFRVYVSEAGVGLVNKTVFITINGNRYNRTTDSNGLASMAVNLISGIYNVTVNVDDIEVNTTATILSTISGEDVVKVFRNGTQYYAVFLDSEGKALANTNVTFNINGLLYTRQTDDSGVARLTINLNPGKYIITAVNPVNGEMSSNNITVLSQFVEHSGLVKVYRNASQYYMKIRAQDGTFKAGVNVTFNINGVFYTRTTNETGHVRLNINLLPGEYIITAYLNGERVSDNITVLKA